MEFYQFHLLQNMHEVLISMTIDLGNEVFRWVLKDFLCFEILKHKIVDQSQYFVIANPDEISIVSLASRHGFWSWYERILENLSFLLLDPFYKTSKY